MVVGGPEGIFLYPALKRVFVTGKHKNDQEHHGVLTLIAGLVCSVVWDHRTQDIFLYTSVGHHIASFVVLSMASGIGQCFLLTEDVLVPIYLSCLSPQMSNHA